MGVGGLRAVQPFFMCSHVLLFETGGRRRDSEREEERGREWERVGERGREREREGGWEQVR